MEKLDIREYKSVVGGVNGSMVGKARMEEIHMGHYPYFYLLLLGELPDKVNLESAY